MQSHTTSHDLPDEVSLRMTWLKVLARPLLYVYAAVMKTRVEIEMTMTGDILFS
jgi:hypothetical protein